MRGRALLPPPAVESTACRAGAASYRPRAASGVNGAHLKVKRVEKSIIFVGIYTHSITIYDILTYMYIFEMYILYFSRSEES
jgi:hypothetical protein